MMPTMLNPKNYWKITLTVNLAVFSTVGAIMGHVAGLTYEPYRYIWINIFVSWFYFSPVILVSVLVAFYYRIPRDARVKRVRQEREQAAERARLLADQKQQAAKQIERERLEKLGRLIRVSVKLKRQEIAEYLGLSGQELFDRLVVWAEEFGFRLDGEDVIFEGAKKDDFITALEKEFASWNTIKKS
jgi:hypothetical protein